MAGPAARKSDAGRIADLFTIGGIVDRPMDKDLEFGAIGIALVAQQQQLGAISHQHKRSACQNHQPTPFSHLDAAERRDQPSC